MRFHVVEALIKELRPALGAEIGVQGGMTTHHLIRQFPDLTMIAIDPWRPMETTIDEQTRAQATWKHEDNYEKVRALSIDTGRVLQLRMTSMEALAHVEDRSLDFIFIDGDHGVESAYHDICGWRPKVKPHGMIIGHDINWPSVHYVVSNLYDTHDEYDFNVWSVPASYPIKDWVYDPEIADRMNKETGDAYKNGRLPANRG